MTVEQMRLEDIRICDAFVDHSHVDFSAPAMQRQYLEILYQESVSLSIHVNPAHLDAKISHCKVMISATQDQVDKLHLYAKLDPAKNREIEDVKFSFLAANSLKKFSEISLQTLDHVLWFATAVAIWEVSKSMKIVFPSKLPTASGMPARVSQGLCSHCEDISVARPLNLFVRNFVPNKRNEMMSL